MGKTQRIEQLEHDRGAANALLRQIGDIVGVDVDDDINTDNVVGYTAKFTAALSSASAITRGGQSAGLSGGGLDTFDEDLDDEIDRANAVAGGARTTALAMREPSTDYQPESSANNVVASICRELGVADGHLLTPVAALREVLARIRTLKGGGDVEDSGNPQVSKGDSLAQAVQHNAAMRQHLDRELGGARGIIGKIASAMQIAQWDADGTEIIEKIQRWETYKHKLSQRIRALRNNPTTASDGPIADELESQLAHLIGTKAFAKWLENKPRGTVSVAALEVAVEPPGKGGFEVSDLKDLATAMSTPPCSTVARAIFSNIAASMTASTEFVRLMNLIILPILARQQAATGAS